MALEIERRFLVRGDHWRRHVRWQVRIQQGYLAATADGLTVRVRRAGQQAWLTIKARPQPGALGADSSAEGGDAGGLIRQEFEYPIPLADAEQLLALAPRQLGKWRHGLDLPGGDWVLDVFDGANAPLVVAEVELADAQQALELPVWCVQELTGRHELSNAALAHTPLAAWPGPQRQALLAALGAFNPPGAGRVGPVPPRSN